MNKLIVLSHLHRVNTHKRLIYNALVIFVSVDVDRDVDHLGEGNQHADIQTEAQTW